MKAKVEGELPRIPLERGREGPGRQFVGFSPFHDQDSLDPSKVVPEKRLVKGQCFHAHFIRNVLFLFFSCGLQLFYILGKGTELG